jgi:hypothetical protein
MGLPPIIVWISVLSITDSSKTEQEPSREDIIKKGNQRLLDSYNPPTKSTDYLHHVSAEKYYRNHVLLADLAVYSRLARKEGFTLWRRQFQFQSLFQKITESFWEMPHLDSDILDKCSLKVQNIIIELLNNGVYPFYAISPEGYLTVILN